MEAYRIDRFGSVDGIMLRSSEDPRPGLREILMRVRATSLNYRDLMVLRGGRGPTRLGVVPLSDGAGEVAAIGEGVTRVKIGDRVAGCFHPRWFGGPIKPEYLTDRLGANLDGMLAEYAVLSEEALVHVPSHLSFEDAATLPCAAVTAWVALAGHRRVTAGDTVLTLGSGGVSVFALQFARLLGAQVIATTSTAEKAERLKALGASDVINYAETPDWDEVGAHVGLTPKRYQSGEIDYDGGVSKCGAALLRTVLYEAAHSLLTHSRKWSWLKAWGVRVAQRRGIRRAIVAVARRLAVVLHRMWVDGSEFALPLVLSRGLSRHTTSSTPSGGMPGRADPGRTGCRHAIFQSGPCGKRPWPQGHAARHRHPTP
jgi:threonine dehydrogenase-like Zn-dependent dehydrogenase